jgi:hypothetical protein
MRNKRYLSQPQPHSQPPSACLKLVPDATRDVLPCQADVLPRDNFSR